MAGRGWLTKFKTKRNGWIWVYHFCRVKPKTGELGETTRNLGSVARFPRKTDAWAEVERRHLIPTSGQAPSGQITVAELATNYRKRRLNQLRVTTQATSNHILDNYILPRWGDSFALEIKADNIEEWLNTLQLANPTKQKICRLMSSVFRRGQKSELLPMTDDGNPVKFVTQSSKTNYRAVIVSPEQAFQIMMQLNEPYRTLVFVVAVTGVRISEALGLQWRDLDYQRKEIKLQRVWVGSILIEDLKTEASRAPVPLGNLLADALKRWHAETPYGKPEDWIFPSMKLSGKKPLSASVTAGDKLRPAAIHAGIRLEPARRFGFHSLRHGLATFLVSRGKDVKTIQELLRHSKSSTTLDLYAQAIDAAKLDAQQEIAIAIAGAGVAAD